MYVVGIDQALEVKKDQDHSLGPGRMLLGFHWARLTLWKPLPGLLHALSGVKKIGILVHGDNIVKHRHGAAVDHHQKCLTCSHSPSSCHPLTASGPISQTS
jgi:hypothetical protein